MKYSLLKLSALTAIMNPANAAFHEKSTVNTPEGRVAIGRLKVGQEVNSYSPLTTARGKARIIDKQFARQLSNSSCVQIDIDTRKIKATPDQLFFDLRSEAWIKARDLEAGNHVLLGEDASPIDIKDVQLRKKHMLRFPIELSVNSPGRALFVDGVLCHNMNVDELLDKAQGVSGWEAFKHTVMKSPDKALTWAAVGGFLWLGNTVYNAGPPSPRSIAVNPLLRPEPGSEAEAIREIMHQQSAPAAVEIKPAAPAAAPRPAVAQSARPRPGQVFTADRYAHVVLPTSAAKRAVIQIPDYSHQRQFPGAGAKVDRRNTQQVEADRKKEIAEQEKRDAERRAKIKQEACEKQQAEKAKRAQEWQEALQRAADKRAAAKAQMEGRAAAIEAADAKTSEERRAAIKAYDESQAIPPRIESTPEIVALPAPTAVAVVTKTHMAAAETLRERLIRQAKAEARYNAQIDSENMLKAANIKKDDEAKAAAQDIIQKSRSNKQ